ncbi:RidA family protein [Candidatus Marinimicrobia bacterium MT.SAG.4]|nr:RidA family protein [Candidatus Marinimicrobia bacterium MT.SAG.4]
MTKQIVHTTDAPQPVGAYSQAVKTGNLLFVSGQIPIDPDNGELVQGTFKERARQVLNNIKNIVEAAGTDMNNVVKTTVFLTDLSNFAEVNEVYSEFFASDPPARAAVQVSKLPLGADIEIECIAEIG